jgi:hypothetical protein
LLSQAIDLFTDAIGNQASGFFGMVWIDGLS